MKKRELKKYIRFTGYAVGFVGLIFFLYLSIPYFFDYEKNKLIIQKKIYNNFNLNINIVNETKAKYSAFPSPRLHLYNIEISDFSNNINKIGSAQKITLKIPFKKLMNFQKLDFSSAKLFKAKINIQSSEIKSFYKYIKQEKHKKPVRFSKSKINFLNKEKLLFTIVVKKLNIFNKDLINNVVLQGKTFNNKIKIKYQYKNLNKEPISIFTIAFPEFGLKINSNINFDKKDTLHYGNTKVIYHSNQFYFEHKFSKKALNIYNSNLVGNSFKGKLLGEIMFLPFLFFDLKLDINSFGFTKFINNAFKQNNNFLSQLIPFNSKINGNLNINIDEIKSSSRIINSANAKLEFKNADIVAKEIILNLNKFGTIKISGYISEQKNKKIFNFSSDIDITNQKFFYSRFLIPKRKRTLIRPINLTGKVNLDTYEINLEKLYYNEKLNNDSLLILNEMINNNISQQKGKNFFRQSNLRKMIKSLFE